MQVLHERPPNWDDLKKHFTIPDDEKVFFSYGDVVYSPGGISPSAELIAHEETHLEQQGHNRTAAKIWYQRYLLDPAWRAEQEAEAYGAQYSFYCRREKDKNKRQRYLHQLAAFLASDLYGAPTTHSAGMKKILDYAQGKALEKIEDEVK